MNDRFQRFLLAVGLLCAAWLMFGPEPPGHLDESPGTTEERGRDGQRAAAAWLSARGYRVHSHRRPWVDLKEGFPQGHVLISDLRDTKFAKVSSIEEDRALQRWVAAGNTWVAMIGVLGIDPTQHPDYDEDRPNPLHAAVLERAFGWRLEKAKLPTTGGASKPAAGDLEALMLTLAEQRRRVIAGEASLEALVLVPSEASTWASPEMRAAIEVLSAGPYRWTYRTERSSDPSDYFTDHCHELEDLEAYTRCSATRAAQWVARKPKDWAEVLLRAETQPELEAAWAVPFGRGWVVVAAAGFWSNANLAKADNAALLEHWLKRFLPPGGSVLFDDHRQGLTEVYDDRAFYADPRLHYTLLVIALVWLAYVVGRGTRLLPPRAVGTTTDGRALVLTLAEWYARKLRPAEVAGALVGHFLDRQRRRLGLGGEAAVVWEHLAREGRMPSTLRDALRQAPETVRSLGALLRLLNEIERADRLLGTRSSVASGTSSRADDSTATGAQLMTTTPGGSK